VKKNEFCYKEGADLNFISPGKDCFKEKQRLCVYRDKVLSLGDSNIVVKDRGWGF